MDYKATYDWYNYPYIEDRQDDLTLDYDPGVNPEMATHIGKLGMTIGNPGGKAYMNRAYMNVDQFNYLAGRLNSVTHIKPYTFNDYYEFWPYDSGAYIVPKDLYTVEFLMDTEEAATYGCPADDIEEALYGISGLLRDDVSDTMMSEFMDSQYMRRSALPDPSFAENGIPKYFVTSASEILFWYKCKDYGETTSSPYHSCDGSASIFDSEKDFSYYFGFVNHTTGWEVKRSPEGLEGFEQWEAVAAEVFSARAQVPGGMGNLTHEKMSGSWWYHKARLLDIPIYDESHLPNNYTTEMEKHGTELDVYNNEYDITVKKTANPIDFSYKNATAIGDTEYHRVTGMIGFYRTDFNSGGDGGSYAESAGRQRYWTGDVSLEVFPVKTENFSIKTQEEGVRKFRNPIGLTRGRITSEDGAPGIGMISGSAGAGRVWTNTPPHSQYRPCSGGSDADHAGADSRRASSNAVAIYSDLYYHGSAPEGGEGITSCTAYDDLDLMPEYFHNAYLSNWSVWPYQGLGKGNGRDFIWDERFYEYNDYFLKRGYGEWIGDEDGGFDIGKTWTNRGGHVFNIGNPIGADAPTLGTDAGDWTTLGAAAGVNFGMAGAGASSDRIWQNTRYEGVYDGFKVGYNSGEVYQRPILKARHLLLNKSQSQVDGQQYESYYGLEKLSRVHHNTYEILPFPSKKNLSYGRLDPTGDGIVKIDPTNLYDPLHAVGKTYWLKIDDVKAKAKELGFRFEFRRLAVPFKLEEYSFSYEPVGFMRESGDCIVTPDHVGLHPTTGLHPNGCGATAAEAWADNGPFKIDLTGVLNGNRIFNPCGAGLGFGGFGINGLYVQAPLDGCPVGPLSCTDETRGRKWPNFIDENPWGDKLEGGWSTFNLRNPINAIYGDDIDSNNVIFQAADIDSWLGGASIDGGGVASLAHIGANEPEPRTHSDNANEGPGGAWGEHEELLGDHRWLFKVEGSQGDGSFQLTSTGYKPMLGSTKQWVWANNVDETTWVKPVGVQERYTYKYDSNISSFDMHVIDFVAEQAQLNKLTHPGPHRLESVSSWSGNYIWAGEEAGHKGGFNELCPVADVRYVEDSHHGLHLSVVNYLSVLAGYDQTPLLKVTADAGYKEWLANVVLNLYPKYYYFQEYSDDEFSKNHAMFAWGQPDVKYDSFPESDYGTQVSAEGWKRGKGYELHVLDIVNKEQQILGGGEGFTAVRAYPLIYGLHAAQMVGDPGEEVETAIHPAGGKKGFANDGHFHADWSDSYRFIPYVNSVPSLYTEFWPRQNVNASGAFAQPLVFGETTTYDLGSFFFGGTSSEVSTDMHINLQDQLGDAHGYRAVLQWYLNNAIAVPTGASNPKHALGNSAISWEY